MEVNRVVCSEELPDGSGIGYLVRGEFPVTENPPVEVVGGVCVKM